MIKRLLTLRVEDARFARRGFEVSDPETARRLETMLESFVGGYNSAVRIADAGALSERLYRSFDSHQVGFAFEGVGLYLALLDLTLPGRANRLANFVTGANRDHDYIVAVGAGFAVARLPWGARAMDGYLKTLDPFIAWCVPAGWGFHEGYFKHKQYLYAAQEPPASLPPLGKQIFDSGLGRSLWWVSCADPDKIRAVIDGFPESRRPEMWAGIGIACCYAGGVDREHLRRLKVLAGPYSADFLSGLPFAARLRQKAANYSDTTEAACRVLLNWSTDQTADAAEAAADAVRSQVHGEGITAAYDLVRRHLVTQFANVYGGQLV